MDFTFAKEAAEKRGISQRRVSGLCAQNKSSAQRIENMRLISVNAEKTADAEYSKLADKNKNAAKPFLKWAGGKGQLIKEISAYYPFSTSVTKYVEPFVGGGAILFDVLNKFDLEEVYLNDINEDLINCYTCVQDCLENLLELLKQYQAEYIPLPDDDRKKYYLAKRALYNDKNLTSKLDRAGLLIFLNKTCFNGLYRVNRSGAFNVPIGRYKNPLICNEENLWSVSKKLQKTKIFCGDYKKTIDVIDKNTFVYIDPPYRPLSETAYFTSYANNEFSDTDQKELADYINETDRKGAKFLLSNSDPKNVNKDDNFFDELYAQYRINRIEAARMINCKSEARGKISELLISNF